MIPQKLQIKNFLSYGSQLQTIDFTNYSLICLSGKNGHGKSALLDAMTWAVWGQARKLAGAVKADQGLLRLGQTQMMVVFDFLFSGTKYRIRREYMETYGKPINTLEFGIINTETDTLIPLTDKTIRTTQEKIEQTLRLDFESFSNSAFLRQGSSNEFSKKSPKDRKHILATILGLDQYEVIRKLAQDKIREAQSQKALLITLQEKRAQELLSQESLDAETADLAIQINTLEQKEKEIHHYQQIYIAERNACDEIQKKQHNLSFQLQQLKIATHTYQQELRDQREKWRKVNRKKQSVHTINHLEQEKNKTIAAIVNHQKSFQKHLENQQVLLHLRQEITVIEQLHQNEQMQKHHALQLDLERLLGEQKNRQSQLVNTKNVIQQCTQASEMIASQIVHHQQELSFITQTNEEITHQESHLERRKIAYQHYVSLGNWFNSELNSLSNRKKLVHGEDPSCPLCEQNLSAARKRFLKLNFEKQESFLAHRLRRLKRIIPVLKQLLIDQHALLIKNKEQLQLATTIKAKLLDLSLQREKFNEQIIESTKTCTQIEQEIIVQEQMIALKQAELDKKPVDLTNHSHYNALTSQKDSLEKQLSNHTYNQEEYAKDQEKLQLLELQLAQYTSLQQELTEQESCKNNILKICTDLKQLRGKVVIIENEYKELGDCEAQLATLQQKEKDIEYHHLHIKQAKEELLHKRGSIESQHKYLAKIKSDFEKEQQTIVQLEIAIDDYQNIATATGKDGIQALLIEEAIPEIEQEANYLLSRLTNNQAQIFIESLRDLKKGGTKETLDIKISDQVGIRPYELFSGGEAFRIDFALRIAISKLLARRAGTALQLLIIDEGFGSQDEEGLGYIMDALYKIQDDFSKIIIVSHLPTMKDQFPVHFFIEKGVQGSTVNVIEQG